MTFCGNCGYDPEIAAAFESERPVGNEPSLTKGPGLTLRESGDTSEVLSDSDVTGEPIEPTEVPKTSYAFKGFMNSLFSLKDRLIQLEEKVNAHHMELRNHKDYNNDTLGSTHKRLTIFEGLFRDLNSKLNTQERQIGDFGLELEAFQKEANISACNEVCATNCHKMTDEHLLIKIRELVKEENNKVKRGWVPNQVDIRGGR